MMRKILTATLMVILVVEIGLFSSVLNAAVGISQLWGSAGELWNPAGRLPDFSYAGYEMGEKQIPNVPTWKNIKTDFAAKGDGITDDTQQFKNAFNDINNNYNSAIPRALYIPAGTYVLSDILPEIKKPNIVIKGAGQGQTILKMTKGTYELGKLNNYFGPFLITFSGQVPRAYNLNQFTLYGTVIQNAIRGNDKTLKLSSTTGINAGDWLLFVYNEGADTKKLRAEIKGSSIFNFDSWLDAGKLNWVAKVVSIDHINKTITLNRTVRISSKPSDWITEVRAFTPNPNVYQVGVEDLTIDFPGFKTFPNEPFVHHRNYGGSTDWRDGYEGIQMNGVKDGWIKNVNIIDSDIGMQIGWSARNITVENVTITAVDKTASLTGHYGIMVSDYSQDVLIDKIKIIKAHYVHSVAQSNAVTTVFSDIYQDTKGLLSLDNHKGGYEVLFTQIKTEKGASLWSTSAGRTTTGVRLTYWNVVAVDGKYESTVFPLWGFVQFKIPNFVGMDVPEWAGIFDTSDFNGIKPYTNTITFSNGVTQTYNSTGSPWFEKWPGGTTQPLNLYKAQLAYRLGQAQDTTPPKITQIIDGDDWWLPANVPISKIGTQNAGYWWWNNLFTDTATYGTNFYKFDYTSVILSWDQINPSPNVYDFSKVESQLSKLQPHQKLTVHLWPNTWSQVPDWVKTMYPNVKYIQDLVTSIWVPGARDELFKAIKKLGATYSNHPKVAFMHIPGLTGTGSEYYLGYDVIVKAEELGVISPEMLKTFSLGLIDAAVAGFAGNEGKLVWTGTEKGFPTRKVNGNDYYPIPYEAGKYALGKETSVRIGTPDESIDFFAEDRILGVSLNAEGYLIIDETHPLMDGKINGGENEFIHLVKGRTPPTPSYGQYNHFRLAQLKSLQLRENLIMLRPDDYVRFQALNDYIWKELGKTVYDSPDAWAMLREGYNKLSSTKIIKNLERFLIQRDIPGGMTVPTLETPVPSPTWYDSDTRTTFEARRTDRATNNNYIYFNVDDRFIKGGINRVYIKVTYLDNNNAKWGIEYDAADGNKYKPTPSVSNANDGKWKTVTFEISDAAFQNTQQGSMDFRIYNGGSQDITVGMVRVLRLDNPSAGTPPKADLNNDQKVDIKDIQLCVKVILSMETTPEIIQRAKEVALPLDKADIKDIQGIVKIILGG